MSVEQRDICPPQLKTVIEIWNQTLGEARLTNDEALAAASMLMGSICLNSQKTEENAHYVFSLAIWEIHQYISVNWHQVQAMQRAARARKNGNE